MDVPQEQRFHFHDGSSVGSLKELLKRLENIGYREFYQHVNTEKNDFANWVRHVLHNEELASDMEKVTSIVETVEIINDFLRPRPATAPHDDIQSRIEEERLEIRVPVEEKPREAPPQEEHLAAIQEHLDKREDPAAESQAAATEHPANPDEHVLSKDDYTRLIVKDFMYGLIFGLIIGLILGRILSF